MDLQAELAQTKESNPKLQLENEIIRLTNINLIRKQFNQELFRLNSEDFDYANLPGLFEELKVFANTN